MKDKAEIDYMIFMRDSGVSISEIAKKLNFSRPTVRKYLKQHDQNKKFLQKLLRKKNNKFFKLWISLYGYIKRLCLFTNSDELEKLSRGLCNGMNQER